MLLVHPQRPLQFEWVADVPGVQLGHRQRALAALQAQVGIQDVDDEGLRRALEQLPCCTLGPDLQTPGDPLNIVIIGAGRRAFIPFVRQGWDPTETLSRTSVWRTIASSLFGGRYRTAPVSPLFVFGRPQDVALQKARATVDERNHLRVWLTPLRYQGLDVWIGQISRDIGVRLSSEPVITHQIDPEVDDGAVLPRARPRALGRGGQDRLGHRRGAGRDLRPAVQLHGRSLLHRRHPRRAADGGTAVPLEAIQYFPSGRPAAPGASGVTAYPRTPGRASCAEPAAAVPDAVGGTFMIRVLEPLP